MKTIKSLFFFCLSVFLLIGLSSHHIPDNNKARALSLKILNKKLKEYKDDYPPEVLNLGGITRLIGFIIDEKNQDIVLYGEVDTNLPPLSLGDFVIAIKNVRHYYVNDNKHGQSEYSYPSCTIEMDEDVLQQLKKLNTQIAKAQSIDDYKEIENRWFSVCLLPQIPQVFGIPPNSVFAGHILQADYVMKALVNGSIKTDTDILKSLLQLRFEKRIEDIKEGNFNSKDVLVNRFWFYPNEPEFSMEDEIAQIEKIDIKLLTEQEYLTESGQTQQSGKQHKLATSFAGQFNEHYQELSAEFPEFQQLNAMYYHFALAKLMDYYELPPFSKSIIDEMINSYKADDYYEAPVLKGHANSIFTDRDVKIEGEEYNVTFFIPACGGVSMEMQLDKTNVKQNRKFELLKIKKNILMNKPKEELYWDFEMEDSN